MTDELLLEMHESVIVGSTSVGEIMHGLLSIGTVVLSVSFFESTLVSAFPVFGGSAGVYNPNLKSMIFLGKNTYAREPSTFCLPVTV